MKTGKFGIPGKKALFKGFGRPEVVVMDVTETAIERPKKNRKNTIQERKNTTASKCKWLLIKKAYRLFA
ncbi:MAG: hypothetical protein HGA42_20655 [Nostocales cyanobacterium W4_Combined_metabat2_030]|nr:hypothetical protein [Nostocales cyanobacterium W4_Combined_metabat2_030]